MGSSKSKADVVIERTPSLTESVHFELSSHLRKDDISENYCLLCVLKLDDIYYFLLPKCNHVVCTKCLCQYIETSLAPKIKCPSKECLAQLSDSIIRDCLSTCQIDVYDRLCSCIPNAVKCLVQECPYFGVPENNEGHFVCPICCQPNCLCCKKLHLSETMCDSTLNENVFKEAGANILREKELERLRQMERESGSYLNPEKSICANCSLFLIPRQGIQMRRCMHNFCRDCLEQHLKAKDSVHLYKCLICDVLLEDRECRDIVGDETVHTMSMKAVEHNFFNCQGVDCDYFWDPGEYTGLHKCPKCKVINCLGCKAIHEGSTCQQYKNSDAYKKIQKSMKILKKFKSVTCFRCKKVNYIQEGGCGAIRCGDCRTQVCQFTSLAVGIEGCKCTAAKPCHEDCKHGCYPETVPDPT